MTTRLAVLAALATVVAATVVIAASGGSQTQPRPSAPAPASLSRHHFWLVRSGQTLSEIASRTAVASETIRRLNPRLDLAVLHAGEKVLVRP
ncbi:MAG: LysM peptidoglycan-binding domain-containing protein [Solirubrobacteraceae bacterium]